MTENKREAVPVPSVAADGEQPQMTSTSTPMIPTTPEKVNQGNDCHPTLEEMYREMQRMNDPGYMHTVTLAVIFSEWDDSGHDEIGSVLVNARVRERQILMDVGCARGHSTV